MRWRGREEPSPLILWYAAVVTTFVAIGTLLPFSFNQPFAGPADWFGLSLISWPPSPPADIAANIVVYLPVGALFTLLIGRFTRSRLVALTLAFVFGTMMSITLEWLQTMMSVRVASWVDVSMNVLGTLLGAIMATLLTTILPVGRRAGFARRSRNGEHGTPYQTTAVALTIGLVLYHLLPFDFVTSTAALRRSMGQTTLWPLIGGPPSTMDPTGQWIQWAGFAGQFALLGLLTMLACRERGIRLAESLRRSLTSVALVPLTIEILQVFVVSHAFDPRDWLAAVAGGLLGLAVAGWHVRTKRRYARREPSIPPPKGVESQFPQTTTGGGTDELRNRLPTLFLLVVLTGQITYLLATSATPFNLSWGHVDGSRLLRWPFAAAWARPFAPAIADLSATAVTFTVMALLVRTLVRTMGPRLRILTVMAVVFSAALGCEFLQLLTSTRYPDPTDPLIASCVALPIAAWRDLSANHSWRTEGGKPAPFPGRPAISSAS